MVLAVIANQFQMKKTQDTTGDYLRNTNLNQRIKALEVDSKEVLGKA